MNWITVEDGRISGYYEGDSCPENGIQVDGFRGLVGEPVVFYDKDWKRKDSRTLMREGLVDVPKGFRLTDDGLEMMTDEELVEAGLRPRTGETVDGNVFKTAKDRLNDGEVSKKEYIENIKGQLASVDAHSIRSIRSILCGHGTKEDYSLLARDEKMAEHFRSILTENPDF